MVIGPHHASERARDRERDVFAREGREEKNSRKTSTIAQYHTPTGHTQLRQSLVRLVAAASPTTHQPYTILILLILSLSHPDQHLALSLPLSTSSRWLIKLLLQLPLRLPYQPPRNPRNTNNNNRLSSSHLRAVPPEQPLPLQQLPLPLPQVAVAVVAARYLPNPRSSILCRTAGRYGSTTRVARPRSSRGPIIYASFRHSIRSRTFGGPLASIPRAPRYTCVSPMCLTSRVRARMRGCVRAGCGTTSCP